MLCKEPLRFRARVVTCSILNQDQVPCRLLKHAREKSRVGRRVEAACQALMKEAPCKVINQAEDLPAFAFAGGLHHRLLSTSRPGVSERPPLGKAGLIAEQHESFLGAGQSENLRPGLCAPAPPRHFIEMIGHKGRFLKTEAEVLEQFGNVKDAVLDAEFLDN